MQRGRRSTLLLAFCLVLAVALAFLFSSLPNDVNVIDNDAQARQFRIFGEIPEMTVEEMAASDGDHVPYLYIRAQTEENSVVVDGATTESLSYARLFWIENDVRRESYAYVRTEADTKKEEEGPSFFVSPIVIGRKGRFAKTEVSFAELGAFRHWVLTAYCGAGPVLPNESGASDRMAVHLVLNETDMGRYLLFPDFDEENGLQE